MVLASAALVVVELFLLAYCVLSVVTTPAEQVRHLPRYGWLLLVVVLPLAGSIAWLVAGRAPGTVSAPGGRSGLLAHDRRAGAPDDDAAFLDQLRARAEAQRAEAERLRREAAQRERRPEGHPEPPVA